MPDGGVMSVFTATFAALPRLPPKTACAAAVTVSAPAGSTAASVVSYSAAFSPLAAHTVPAGISAA